MTKTAIITGITGQDGAYLSQLLIKKGYRVIGFVRPKFDENFFGLKYVGVFDEITFEECDLTDYRQTSMLIKKYQPNEIYNLAAQSSVGLSFEKPLETIHFNVLSVANLLEAIKEAGRDIKFYQASSSDMFGNIKELPAKLNSLFHPTSPYAISKITGHWTTVNYRESYGIFACCGILFNHESYLRGDGFFVKKVIKTALAIKAGSEGELRVGNLDLKRDFGYAPDYVRAMWLMLQQEKPDDFLVCSGSSVSLRDIVYYIFDKLEISRDRIVIDKTLFRPNDIKNIYGDNSQAKKKLGWKYDKSFYEVLDILIQEELQNESKKGGNCE